eukprot:GHVT01096923.1.p1 GENE.GHVT01096923.1~~GHVT01096923.1.p1  ORF type:complete len:459 (+),score=13.06 GHVT01096923.1:899-2275(+)
MQKWTCRCVELTSNLCNDEDLPSAFEDLTELKLCADRLYTASWKALHTGSWHDVNPVWRCIFALASFIEAILFVSSYTAEQKFSLEEESTLASRRESAKRRKLVPPVEPVGCHGELVDVSPRNELELGYFYADMGLIMGGKDSPLYSRFHRMICAIDEMNEALNQSPENSEATSPEVLSLPAQTPTIIDASGRHVACSFTVEIDLPVTEFISNYLLMEKPVILKGAVSSWPAINKWTSINYLQKVAGRRTVPVEIGSTYTSSKWTQKLLTVGDFLHKYINNSDTSGIAYVAQHELLEQIPRFNRDVPTPDYALCGSTDTLIRMFWLGPAGTISPLHTDNYENVFAQVVGYKYVRVYHPQYTPNMYPFKEGLMTNTSGVTPDILSIVDKEKFPDFHEAPYFEAILEPGDLLYIPYNWWHTFKSLSTSISISLWFDGPQKPPKDSATDCRTENGFRDTSS